MPHFARMKFMRSDKHSRPTSGTSYAINSCFGSFSYLPWSSWLQGHHLIPNLVQGFAVQDQLLTEKILKVKTTVFSTRKIVLDGFGQHYYTFVHLPLISAIKTSRQHQINSCECRESNPGLLRKKHKRYLWASCLNKISRWDHLLFLILLLTRKAINNLHCG